MARITKTSVYDIATADSVTATIANRPLSDLEANVDDILAYINNETIDGDITITESQISNLGSYIETVAVSNSIAGDGAGTALSLVNDLASPGNNKLYGTDGSGVRGWFDQPSGSGSVDETADYNWTGLHDFTPDAAPAVNVITVGNSADANKNMKLRWVGTSPDRLAFVPSNPADGTSDFGKEFSYDYNDEEWVFDTAVRAASVTLGRIQSIQNDDEGQSSVYSDFDAVGSTFTDYNIRFGRTTNASTAQFWLYACDGANNAVFDIDLKTAYMRHRGGADLIGRVRISDQTSAPSDGAGMEMFYNGTESTIQSYDRDASAWIPLNLRGEYVVFDDPVYMGGSEITTSSASLQVNGFMRTGNIYLHQGGNNPTAQSRLLSNDNDYLSWGGVGIEIDGAEGNTYQYRAAQNSSTGVAVRATNNPASGSPIFSVESSGAAVRLEVQHNGATRADKFRPFSDPRMKTKIANMQDMTAEDWDGINFWYFYWNENKHRDYGAMSDEVAYNGFPELCGFDKDGFPTDVDYDKLSFGMARTALNEVKLLKRRIAELEAR